MTTVKWIAQGGNGAFIFDKEPSRKEMYGEPTFGYSEGDCKEIAVDAVNKLDATYGKCTKITIEEV